MKNLVEKILELRKELCDLEREKRKIQSVIKEKSERLESLEILTVNQLEMFEDESIM